MSPPEKKKTLTGSLNVKSVILKKAKKRIKSLKVSLCKKKLHLELQNHLTFILNLNTLTTSSSVNTVLKAIKQQMDVTNINQNTAGNDASVNYVVRALLFPKNSKYTSKFTQARICIHALIIKEIYEKQQHACTSGNPSKSSFHLYNMWQKLILNLI